MTGRLLGWLALYAPTAVLALMLAIAAVGCVAGTPAPAAEPREIAAPRPR